MLSWNVPAVAQSQAGPAPVAPANMQMPALPVLKKRLEDRLAELRSQGFEGVVRVDFGNQTVIRTAVGDADPVSGRPFRPDTQVDMGSISKPFTAIAILKLQEQGKLSVKDTLAKFFPNAPSDKAGITVEQLLTHTAGFPGFVGSDFEPIDRATFEDRALKSQLRSKPGESYNYSNVGFGLLAAIIERASGESYERYLIENVLKPAGIARTGYGSVLNPKNIATDPKGRPVNEASWAGAPHWNLIGNGGLLTTADDMIAFLKAFQAGKIVSRASVDEAERWHVNEEPGGSSGYGYGLTLMRHPTLGRDVWHNGGNPFFTAEFHLFPETGLVLFVASNSYFPAPEASMKLIRAIFGRPDMEPSLPEAPDGKLAADFKAALLSPDPAVRRAFVETRFSDRGAKGRIGVEGVAKILDQVHDQYQGATFVRLQRGGPGTVLLLFSRPGQKRLEAVQVLVEPGAEWKVRGFRSPD